MFGKNIHDHESQKNSCLKCQYEKLFKTGKTLFDEWDKQPPAPAQLLKIKKQLNELKIKIEEQKNDSELKFCANHPEIFDFLPLEVL